MKKIIAQSIVFASIFVLTPTRLNDLNLDDAATHFKMDTKTGDVMYRIARDKMNDLAIFHNRMKPDHSNRDGCDYQCRFKKWGWYTVKDQDWLSENIYHGLKTYPRACDIRQAIKSLETSPPHAKVLSSNYTKGVVLIESDGAGGCYVEMLVSGNGKINN